MVTVNSINWISYEGMEAEISVTDGTYELICFSHPCTLTLNQEFVDMLHCLNTTNVSKLDQKIYYVNKNESSFSHRVIGQIVDIKKRLVQVGEVILQLEQGKLPGDINIGDYISFTCQRIDIY